MHDWFIALTAASFGQVSVVDRPLTRYRQHEGNKIGASSAPLLARGLAALKKRKDAKRRILLTYTTQRSSAGFTGMRFRPRPGRLRRHTWPRKTWRRFPGCWPSAGWAASCKVRLPVWDSFFSGNRIKNCLQFNSGRDIIVRLDV